MSSREHMAVVIGGDSAAVPAPKKSKKDFREEALSRTKASHDRRNPAGGRRPALGPSRAAAPPSSAEGGAPAASSGDGASRRRGAVGRESAIGIGVGRGVSLAAVTAANKGPAPAHRRVVCSNDTGLELSVHVRAEMSAIICFLKDPKNLTQWTGHKSIHFSEIMNSWVETRMSPEGQLKDYELVVKVEKGSKARVSFLWPERKLAVKFVLEEVATGFCKVEVSLPRHLGELGLSRMKRIITMELDLLKALIEGNVLDVIPSQTFRHIQSYHMGIKGITIRNNLPEDAADKYGFNGEIVRDGSIMTMMSADFGQTITSQPLAVLIPKKVEDILAAVKMASECDIPLACRGSRVSHSAGGQAQANNGLILDMSALSSVKISQDGLSVTLGPGTFWDEVIRLTLAQGLMPPVINDYQYLSVGGTISMGGVGFMSHKLGVQAAYVNQMDVVTGLGDLITCSSEENIDLFDGLRGGLGQCGIMTSVTLPLVPAPKQISIFKLFYHAKDVKVFSEKVAQFVRNGKVDMIHAFLKPCDSKTLSEIVGNERFLLSSNEFKSAIKYGESQQGLVFFLELGCYIWDTVNNSTAEMLEMLITDSKCICGQVFNETENFYTYITKDPPVVRTNKTHGSIPHPSFATIIDERHVSEVLNHHITSRHRGNDDVNEILIMPIKSNAHLKKGYHTPMFPLPSESNLSFFLLFLGSVMVSSESASFENIMENIRNHHRGLHELSSSLGGKRYSYCTITSEVKGEESWKAHYGESTWESLCVAKRKYDPYHIFCPGIKMWD